VVLAAWVLLLAATTLLTAGTLYADAVALGGLRASVGAAPAADRSIRVDLSSRTGDVSGLDGIVRPHLQGVVDVGGGGTVGHFLSSTSMAPASEPVDGPTLVILASRPGIEDHATLTAGRWPQAGAPIPEAVLSTGAAAALGVAAGDHLALVDRIHPGPARELAVVGTYQPDAGDPYWLDDELDLSGRFAQGSFTTYGPVVVPEADLLAAAPGGTVNVEWRATPAVDRLTAETIQPLAAAAAAAPAQIRASLPSGFVPQILGHLPDILGRVDRSVLVGRSGVLVLVLEFAVVAAYAIVLVAGMLADRRRAETALLRTRGASGGHIAGISLAEAVLLAGTAALVSPWISLGIVGVLGTSGALTAARGSLTLSQAALVADGLAALAGVLAMTLPNLGGIPSLSGVRAAISRQAGRTLGQRLGLDLALVVLAGVALWQLRLYGAPITRNARGILGIDPLLVAAPGIGLLAGALLATRLLPRAAEVAEPLLARGRGLVGAIGGRGVARRPLRYTRSALLLMLAAALGTFATAHVATWTQSQADQAAYRSGADVRIVASPGGPVPGGERAAALAALPGVEGVMAVDRIDVDSGRSVRGGAALGVDAASVGTMLPSFPSAAADGLPAALAALAAARPDVGGLAIPDEARRISIVVDAELTVLEDFNGYPGDPATDKGLTVRAVVADAAGRMTRFTTDAGLLLGAGQRFELAIGPGTGRDLRAVEVSIAPSDFYGVMGYVDLGTVEWSTDAAPWAPIGQLNDPGATWTGTMEDASGQQGLAMNAYTPPPDHPTRLLLDGQRGHLTFAFGSGQTVDTRVAWVGDLARGVTVSVIASDRFLELTAASVGDTVPGRLRGAVLNLRLVGRVSAFPTLDPSKPFVVLDGPTLALAHYAAAGSLAEPGEWWLSSTDPDATAAAAAAIGDTQWAVTSRTGLQRDLLGDPLALGVIGLLGLGSLAAMVFAAIGFIVNATVSTAEREGELALLRALGLSGGQLSTWLSAEHGFLLVAGLGGGVALGVLLAWLVLPFSTLTTTGEPAVPTPVVIVPIDGLAPVVGLALLVFVVTLLVLRRQLLRLRIGGALRARDE
jgi:FtsX-like permease family protein